MTVLDRFLKYIVVQTTSDEESTTVPTTMNQKDLGNILVQELLELGLEDAHMDDNGYVMATLPSNIDKKVPVLGFIAHMDTSPDMTTVGITPRVVENYDGKDIVLNEERGIILTTEQFPKLANYKGQDIVVTNGLTLLGADDKAGLAEIMTAVAHLQANPNIPHGTIKIGFTPDEEVGKGADHFDVEKFGADLAYTLDGGEIGELEYESFNANNVKMTINGLNVHPGYAKNKMVNAMEIAYEFHGMLPQGERPQFTTGYEGYYHLQKMAGSVEQVKSLYLIRDHDRDLYERRKAIFKAAVDFINAKYGEGTMIADMQDMYYNMGEKIEPVYEVVDIAKEVMEELGIEPKIKAIRGGTDGARLSFMGLPCPNIFAGGHNFHGKFEYVPVQSMEKAVEVILGITQKFAEK